MIVIGVFQPRCRHILKSTDWKYREGIIDVVFLHSKTKKCADSDEGPPYLRTQLGSQAKRLEGRPIEEWGVLVVSRRFWDWKQDLDIVMLAL